MESQCISQLVRDILDSFLRYFVFFQKMVRNFYYKVDQLDVQRFFISDFFLEADPKVLAFYQEPYTFF